MCSSDLAPVVPTTTGVPTVVDTQVTPYATYYTYSDGSTYVANNNGTIFNTATDQQVATLPGGQSNPYIATAPTPPTNLTSTGVSDSAPGTVFTDSNGTQEIVLNSGKTVNLADYQTAQASGQPISVDGVQQTSVTVELQTTPVEPTTPTTPTAPTTGTQPPPSETVVNAVTNPDGTITETMADGSTTTSNATTGQVISQTPSTEVLTASQTLGLTPAQIAALGGVAAATAAVATMGSGGAATAANNIINPPAPTKIGRAHV